MIHNATLIMVNALSRQVLRIILLTNLRLPSVKIMLSSPYNSEKEQNNHEEHKKSPSRT